MFAQFNSGAGHLTLCGVLFLPVLNVPHQFVSFVSSISKNRTYLVLITARRLVCAIVISSLSDKLIIHNVKGYSTHSRFGRKMAKLELHIILPCKCI